MKSPVKMNYSFTICNKSGFPQSYSLFNALPKINPEAENLVSRAILVAKGVPSNAGIATLVLQSDNFYAICGTMYQDEAVQMYVMDRHPVNFGSRPRRGAGKTSGTTVVLKVKARNPPFLCWQGQGLDAGEEGAFCLCTEDYKLADAKNTCATNEPKPSKVDFSQGLEINLAELPPHAVIMHDEKSLTLSPESSTSPYVSKI
ncbi:hypothetical protein E4U43_002364 [Claviceps pusilla]|uniref:Uncharacterized protein n=1 Tax=Claviceps pusilla TaxID=123648 RepID=A0A9P7SYK2_9HYPO|nr:hypothetical protein E4U43_002364 [Claviceps pusilla]